MFLVTGKVKDVKDSKSGDGLVGSISVNNRTKQASGEWKDNWHNYRFYVKSKSDAYKFTNGECVTLIGEEFGEDGTLFGTSYTIHRGEAIMAGIFTMDLYVYDGKAKSFGSSEGYQLTLKQKTKKLKDDSYEKKPFINIMLWGAKNVENGDSNYPKNSTVTVTGLLKVDSKKKEGEEGYTTYLSITLPPTGGIWKGIPAANDGVPGESKSKKYVPREKPQVAEEEPLPDFDAVGFSQENTMADDGDLPF